jgi:hypothetical protein
MLIAAGAACYASMSTTAYAQLRATTRMTGKPLFTIAALNAAIPGRRDPHYQLVFAEISRDPRAFVLARFTLTPEQQAQMNAISNSEMGSLGALFRNAAAHGQGVRAEARETSNKGCGEMFFRSLVGDDAGAGEISNRTEQSAADMRVSLHLNAATAPQSPISRSITH